jgi:hypothetical protein
VSGETPIYDATCRAVGPPPAAGRTSAEASAEVSNARIEADDAHPETAARSSPAAQSGDPSAPSPDDDDDPRTADLSIPPGALSGTRGEEP